MAGKVRNAVSRGCVALPEVRSRQAAMKSVKARHCAFEKGVAEESPEPFVPGRVETQTIPRPGANEGVSRIMITGAQYGFLSDTAQQAKVSGHIFPEMAACEAALESNWGASELAEKAKNLFGCKQHQHPVYGTLNLPTHEYFQGKGWEAVTAEWVEYPTFAACFADRMSTLRRLSSIYPDYAAGLIAQTAEEYVTDISRTWSTDPNRGQDCIEIYRAHPDALGL
jgi:flagellum-specific peptidoglycan hydrolase FlgJ